MKRMGSSGEMVESSAEYEAFLTELLQLCEKHGIWLSHDDYQGGFMLSKKSTRKWLSEAGIEEEDP